MDSDEIRRLFQMTAFQVSEAEVQRFSQEFKDIQALLDRVGQFQADTQLNSVLSHQAPLFRQDEPIKLQSTDEARFYDDKQLGRTYKVSRILG